MQTQEEFSEIVAEQYIIDMIQKEQDTNETIDTSAETLPSDLDYEDNQIYSYFDESYAHGTIDCVIEIPAIDLRQSVFTGTPEQIEHDLSRWLAVTARSDYILGDTHYCIYMHNPRDKSIKISYAQEKMAPGDYMIVTKGSNVYLYTVTNIFSEWREKCTEIYVDNMAVDDDLLYIFTCGRNEWQYKNLVIEGKIIEKYTLNDWNLNKDQYLIDYKVEYNDLIVETEPTIQYMSMEIKAIENTKTLSIELLSDDFKKIENCSIGIFNADGHLFCDPIQYEGKAITTPELQNGEYCIGVYENKTNYQSPPEYQITVTTEASSYIIKTIDEKIELDDNQLTIIKFIAIGTVALMLITSIALLMTKRKK